jgi:glycosyltransferase involved in cell wall biosynthesis
MTSDNPQIFKDLTVCIPAYNEAGAIEATCRQLRANFPEAQILVVDDGSADGTGDIARGVEGVDVIAHVSNRGYGASIKTAIRHADRQAVAWYDSDGQHRPEDLAAVAMPVLTGEKDAVVGARGEGSDVRVGRVPGKMLLKFVAQLIARQRIPDLNSGLRCFRREVILRYLHLLPDGFSASTTSTLLMIKRGYRFDYVPIVTERRIGKSTVKISDGLATLHLMTRLMVLFDAFRFFLALSMAQILPGLIYGVILAIDKGLGFPTFAAMLVISGVLTFLIGLVCDQIAAMRQERFEHG